MNPSTTTSFEFGKNMGVWLIKTVEEDTLKDIIWFFSKLTQFVFAHIFIITISFFALVLFAFGEYLITGRWEMLGSVFYHSFKYIILFVSGLIFGAGIFVSDWFEIVSSIIGVICYFLVGIILKKLDSK